MIDGGSSMAIIFFGLMSHDILNRLVEFFLINSTESKECTKRNEKIMSIIFDEFESARHHKNERFRVVLLKFTEMWLYKSNFS